MSRCIPRLLLALACSLFAVAAWAEEDIIVYSDLTGEFENQRADFNTVVQNSVNGLLRFRATEHKKDVLPMSTPLEERIKAAAKAGVPWLANVSLATDKKKARLTFDIINTAKAESAFHWAEEYKIKNIKGLIAQLEYSMPMTLKARFLELGRVIKKDKRLVYFDLGETAGIKAGDIYRIFVEGNEIEDEDGNSFGRVDETTGIVKVISVTAVYSVAEMIIGELSVEPGNLVKRATNNEEALYRGKILAVLENFVAINVGKNAGVREGSYYAVFRDIKSINDTESFRQPVGYIKVNEVFQEFSKGELSISPTYELTKYTIHQGDRVEEVESPRKDMWSVNRLMTNINSDTSARILYVSYQRDSSVNVDLGYRVKLGYGDNLLASFGVMQSVAHNSNVFAGFDFMYLGDPALNMFVSVDVDTPISKGIKLNLETGYTVAAALEKYNGLNASIGLKYGFDLF